MVAGGLTAIYFLCTLVCWAVWSLVFFTFIAHYFLATLTDSSSGQDEIHYPRESIFDWWWKPIYCVWILLVWLVSATVLLSPLGVFSPTAFLIVWLLVLWLAWPLSLASSLYAQNWLVFVHRGVVGRMLQHAGAFVYVNLVTFGLCAASVWLVGRGLTDGFAWAAAAVLMVPTAILLYARHWGRFAWLSLNFLPRQAKRPRVPAAYAEKPWRDFTPEEAPARRAPIASLPGDGIRAGEPAAASSSSGIRAKTPERQAPPAEKLDEWSDTAPYEVLDDPALPSFPKAPAAPPTPTAAPAAPIVIEEEDEWASNKKPYAVSEEGAPVAPAPADVTTEKSPADTPVSFTQYYEERARQEAEEERRAQEAKRTMPARSKKTPTFQTAFFAGVWNFMFYPNTLVAWANLAVFTLVEFLLLYMLVMFRPRLP